VVLARVNKKWCSCGERPEKMGLLLGDLPSRAREVARLGVGLGYTVESLVVLLEGPRPSPGRACVHIPRV
jgi:hypothetical protein